MYRALYAWGKVAKPEGAHVFGQIMTMVPVRLLNDLPELSLRAGDVGIVRSSWHYPTVAYEVEFPRVGCSHARILLLDGQVEEAVDSNRRQNPSVN
jgi:hypothetical protein